MNKKNRLYENHKKKLKILEYLVRFIILSLPIILIVNLNFYFIQYVYALVDEFLLNLLGIKAVFFNSFSADGLSPSLYYDEKIIRIDSACTGIRSFYLLFAMIFAFKAKLDKKLKYLVIGGFALIFVNILRILVSSILFLNDDFGFDSLVWSTSLNLTAFAIFYFFVKK